MSNKKLELNKTITKNFRGRNVLSITKSEKLQKEIKTMMLLLRRTYNLIEMEHLNDHKGIPYYSSDIHFPKQLGEDIFNYLQTKDQYFRNTTILRQKLWRRRHKDATKKSKMKAEERGVQMAGIKIKDLPVLAYEYAKYLCSRFGMCGEVFITAYAHYAQAIEGLSTDDSLYKIDNAGIEWFKKATSKKEI